MSGNIYIEREKGERKVSYGLRVGREPEYHLSILSSILHLRIKVYAFYSLLKTVQPYNRCTLPSSPKHPIYSNICVLDNRLEVLACCYSHFTDEEKEARR